MRQVVSYLEVWDKGALREEKGVLDKRVYFEKKEAEKEKWRPSKKMKVHIYF